MFPQWAKELLVLADAFKETSDAAAALGNAADDAAGVFGGGAANAAIASGAKVGDFLPGTGERVQSINDDGTTTLFGGLSGFRTVGGTPANIATQVQDPGSLTGNNSSLPDIRIQDLFNGNPIPGFAHGGLMKKDGFAFLHRGESVIHKRLV